MLFAAEWNVQSCFCLQHHGEAAELLRYASSQWSCARYHGLGWYWISLHIAGTLNSQHYNSEVLEQMVLPCIQCLPSANFQQDNEQPHVTRNIQEFFFTHQIEFLTWSACSPNLSPIENM
ncbi:UNVERIFIED_CONTAM: hypothetical protein NCL1_49920 [Trichonephila clavipes]